MPYELTPAVLHHYLWDQARAEQLGLGRIHIVAQSKRLTPEEKAQVDQRVQDEIRHVGWFERAAARYGPPPAPRGGGAVWAQVERDYHAQVHACSPEEMLVYAYIPERFATRMLPPIARAVRAFGDAETADMLDVVAVDEVRHVNENSALLNRWRRVPEFGARLTALFRDCVYTHYHKELFKAPIPVRVLPPHDGAIRGEG
jgi:hypothetical protein